MNKRYDYSGPVFKFETCIEQNWEASTWAPTKKKALSNLTYRYKRDHDMIPSTKIELIGTLVEKGDANND
jgi:predicted lipase